LETYPIHSCIPLVGLLAVAGIIFAAPALAVDGSLFGVTLSDPISVGTAVSVVASIITSTVPTPMPGSSWISVYRVVELLAIVGQRPKANPAAAIRLANTAAAARTVGDLIGVADQAATLARTLSPTATVLDPGRVPCGVSAL
jgi:hypothetical protein